MELMSVRNGFMHSDESVAAGREMRPLKSDIFISTYPKCGTTWMTQIVHGLRSGGSMDFGEITEVVPWDILALDCGQGALLEPASKHGFEPRVWKSHEGWEKIPKVRSLQR